MITKDQEVCCLDCKFHKIYICSGGTPWDSVSCSNDGKPNRYSGCRKYESIF